MEGRSATTPAIRVSARPPGKFAPNVDFNLWIQRFELYLEEAEVPAEKRARELISSLEDGPFRVVSQLGLIEADADYTTIKTELKKQFCPAGEEVEWQYRLQSRRQKPGETLAEFAGELRFLADRAYPDWSPPQRREMARNQFVQGVLTPSTQLELIKGKPTTLEKALEIAQHQESVESAQKRLHATQQTAVAVSTRRAPSRRNQRPPNCWSTTSGTLAHRPGQEF